MEYIELKQLWNQNLETETTINQKAIAELTSLKLKNSFLENRWSSIIEIVISVVWYIFLLNFVIEYYGDLIYLLSGIVLIIICLIGIIIEAKKLYTYNSINYGFSILMAQKQLEKLKRLEIIDAISIFFFVPLFSVPFVIVMSKYLFKTELLELDISTLQICMFLLFSILVVSPIVYFIQKEELKELNESIEFLKEIELTNITANK